MTEKETDMVTHAEQLTKADHLMLRLDSEFFHLLHSESHRVFIVTGDHNGNFLGFNAIALDLVQAFGKTLVILFVGGIRKKKRVSEIFY